MKKLAVFFLIIIIIISTVSYIYINKVFNYKNAQKENVKFSMYIDKEITGFDLTTLINKVVDYNKSNDVKIDDIGYYIDNEKNSLNIDIKFKENEKNTYNMMQIYNNGMNEFLAYYRDVNFKCVQVQYHDTNKIKYMLFEQVTE